MLIEILGTITAGLGLFFIGVKLVGDHLKQLSGRKFRKIVTKVVNNPVRGALLGVLAGAATQSTNAVAYIATSMTTAGLMSLRGAMPVVIWANLGTSALVLAATVDIRVLVLYLLGMVGAAFYFNLDRSSRFRHLIGALLGVALLFLGLQFIKQGAAPLREMQAVRDLLELGADSYLMVFGIGAALTLVAQSSATVSIVAVAMTSVGLLTMPQTMMVIYGAGLGSAGSLWFLSANLTGTSRRIILQQVILKIGSTAIMLILFGLEQWRHIPLVQALTAWITPSISLQAAWVYLLQQLLGCILASMLLGPVLRLLGRLAPATQEEELARPVYLYDQALGDAETALDLVSREQNRLFSCLPDYIVTADQAVETARKDIQALYNGNAGVLREIELFLSELIDRTQDRQTMHRILNHQARNRVLGDLRESLFALRRMLGPADALRDRTHLERSLTEGMHAILRTMAETLSASDKIDLDEDDAAMLAAMTSDRSALMERLRHGLLRHTEELSYAVQESLFAATSLFERTIWLLGRYLALVAPTAASDATPQTQDHQS
ncbi:Na/Pi cotransporter family protein [Desulfonatronum lacustre]|uniref:Na/Pi cotransporter family protein n=1 Tax=Desulfonatronum lacustre TaxID=66849 RepID=UPI00048E09C1|nr:Na/Pi symporter [Desulfonatronum lacustre]